MLEGREKGPTQAGRMGHKKSHQIHGQIKNATPGKEELLEVTQRTEDWRAALADSKQCISKQCSSNNESQQSPKLYLQGLRQPIEGLIWCFYQSSAGNTLLNRKKLKGRAKSQCLLPYKGS